MASAVFLIPALPLAGFLLLATFGRRLPQLAVAGFGVGSVASSAVVVLAIAAAFVSSPPPGAALMARGWRWISVGHLAAGFDLRLDALSLVMVSVVAVVGLLIHIYSVESMRQEDGYSRFFAYMNLFVASMEILLLADNLLLLYLGWEGVGLCSYLLIGFWYRDEANGLAARKAFVVTRIGDTAMALGLFLLLERLGTLDIQAVLQRAAASWRVGSGVAVVAAALLLGGALGKSAQLPLQTWLPDAMAGPTPVSALIHAATMVTAGVYLIARTHTLFTLAPAVQLAVAVIGALTLLLAGFSALVQDDIKRVLAYSTISQIGYMFLALGVGAWSAAIFHFVTHAFFKSLLFLAAGAVISSLAEEHDIHRMGAIRKRLPVVFWTFLAGSAALAGLPLVTAGFYSKDLILERAFTSPPGGAWLWAAGIVGAFLTAVYIFRVVFVAFLGEAHGEVEHRPGPLMVVPLVVLAAASLLAGFVETPRGLGGVHVLGSLLASVLPAAGGTASEGAPLWLGLAGAVVPLAGTALAWLVFVHRPQTAAALASGWIGAGLHRIFAAGWGFDACFDRALVRPFCRLAALNRGDVCDALPRGLAAASGSLNRWLVLTQDGRVRTYAAAVALGAVVLLALVMLP
jgi:NADH-quinone oxidoreductase subunit L